MENQKQLIASYDRQLRKAKLALEVHFDQAMKSLESREKNFHNLGLPPPKLDFRRIAKLLVKVNQTLDRAISQSSPEKESEAKEK